MNALSYPCTPSLPSLSQLPEKVKHIIASTMLCCGRKKESRDAQRQHIIGEESGYSTLAHHHHHQQAMSTQHLRRAMQQSGYGSGQSGHMPLRSRMPEMVVQSDFRKVSGISSEIFRQIEAVENEFDSTTAAYFESVEKRGEMVIRLLDPQTLGRAGIEANRRYASVSADGAHSVQFVEIIKRPGQTLGLYIREGDGYRCGDGVFISRIALESAVYNSGLLKVGDEILAVNLVDVRRMSLDDVVIIMSIPRRLVLTIRSRHYTGVHSAMMASKRMLANDYRDPPVVVVKREVEDEPYEERDSQRDSENGHLMQARLKGLPPDIPATAVPLDGEQYKRLPPRSGTFEDQVLYYNSQASRSRTGARPHASAYSSQVRDDLWSDHRNELLSRTRPYGIVTQQPNILQRQYPRTLENLAEQVHQFYSGYTSDVPQSSARRSGSLQVTRASVHRPPSTARQRYWEEYSAPGSAAVSGSLRRNARLQRIERTESDRGLPPTMSDDFLNRYMKSSLSRGGTPTLPTYQGLASMQDLRGSASSQAIGSILRRRTYLDGSASDTEASSPIPSHYMLRQRGVGPYSRLVSGSSRDSFQLRSSSLPRTRPITASTSDYHYSSRTAPPRRTQQQRQSVRFERQAFGYDDDSDGAVSAPELPATRSRRIGRRSTSPNVYSSHEYRQWMVRAPSTSAIYETVRKGKALPLSSNSLNKIAHSAESLLDTIRTEQQRTLLADLYLNRAAITGRVPSAQLTSSLFAKSRDESSRSLSKAAQQSQLAHSLTYDYLRASIPNPTPVKPTEDGTLHLLSLNPREFFKYRPDKPESGIQNEGFSGLLWVHLLAGRGLRASTGHASEHYRDVYCVIECDRIHKARTVVRSGEHSFDWDEVFELDLFYTKEIAFLLYTWDPTFRHKLCYKGVLNLVSLSLNETPVHSLALKMEPRGTLYVKLHYKDIQSSFQRTHPNSSQIPGNALFGVALETIVNRENSGLNVPLIVKRCVEEVDKRGVDLVGVYRLCGSAVRKKLLRESFEKNAWLVDLTAEHVPDINVITSLLKDYLRELPEPLFTKALFEMMDDGLSVCLPDDQTGNAKLMFSILECLPKTNRCVVFFLIDHLKKITTRSERNKMSSQALAICFGPLFTCHSESETLHKPIEVFKFLLDIWPERRGSASRSESNDLMSSKVSGSLKMETSLPPIISSHQISSIAQSIAMTSSVSATTHSQLPTITIPSAATLSMLPTETLTPGPSPTALTLSEAPLTTTAITAPTSSVVADVEFTHFAAPTVSSLASAKKTVAWASTTNNHNSSGGGGSGSSGSGSGGASGQSRVLPDTPC